VFFLRKLFRYVHYTEHPTVMLKPYTILKVFNTNNSNNQSATGTEVFIVCMVIAVVDSRVYITELPNC